MNLAAERIESVKAGSLGAIATTAAATLFALIPVQPLTFLGLLLHGTIAAAAGFLFGVTYRYIVRQDNNAHLKQGAVLAFGLVRGLALVEEPLRQGLTASLLGSIALPVIASVGMMAIAALVLEWALHRGWLKPFSA